MRAGFFGAGRRLFSSFLFAVFFIFVGVIIASMLDLPSTPIARENNGFSEEPIVAQPQDFSTPFVKVVGAARDAVVNVVAESESIYRGVAMDDYFRLFGFNQPRRELSYGSGFIFRKDGYILTNSHVVNNAIRIMVTLSGDESYEAKLIGTDPATDLAVLKIETKKDLPFIPFGHSDSLQIGEWVVAIGNPFAQQGLDRTVTAGVVSGTGRKNLRFAEGDVAYQNYIQTDASINPGNSGGPLLNLRGQAIGVNAAISSPTGVSVGIGFAIPIDYARAVVPDLIEYGQVSRGWLGLGDIRDLSKETAEGLKLSSPAVTFDKVLRGSPAAKSGLQPGDIILKYNGKSITDANDFRFLIASTPANQTVNLDLLRDGHPLTVAVTIGDRSKALNEIKSSSRQTPDKQNYWQGMAVSECTPELAYRLGVECPTEGGVIVTAVASGSPADKRNIVPGIIIIEIDRFVIKNMDDYRKVTAQLRDKRNPISLIIYDTEGNTRWVAINPAR